MKRIHAAAGRPLTACVAALATLAIGATAEAAGDTGRAIARQARRVSLVENARLSFSAEHGSALVEHGRAVGTYDAPVAVTLTIRPKSVTAVVALSPSGGSIVGVASANYVVRGSYGYFGGTFTLRKGAGRYAHISEVNGKPLGFSGRINRYSFAMEVKAHGEVNL